MKKGLLTLAAVATAFSVFAQDAPKPAGPAFTFNIAGQASASMFTGVTKIKDSKGKDVAYTGDFVESRVRPEFKLSNGTSEFSMRFEIDATHGVAASSTADLSSGKVTTTNGGQRNLDQYAVEVAWFYFKSKVSAVQGLSLQGGFIPADYGFWYADNIGTLGASFDAGIAKVNFGWHQLVQTAKPAYDVSKTSGGDTQLTDADFFGLNADVKAGDITVTPMLAFARYGKNSSGSGVMFRNGNQIMLGTKAKGKMGDLSFYFHGQYAQGSQKEDLKATSPVAKMDFSGYAIHFAPAYTTSGVTVGAFGTYVTGDDPSTTDKVESFTSLCLDGVAGAGASKMMLLEDAGMVGGANSSNYTGARVRGKNFGITAGYLLAGITASTKIGVYTPTFAFAWGQTAEKISATYDKKDLGMEFDLYNKIALSPGTNLELDLGYLLTGKAYEYKSTTAKPVKANNAYVVSLGIQQKM